MFVQSPNSSKWIARASTGLNFGCRTLEAECHQHRACPNSDRPGYVDHHLSTPWAPWRTHNARCFFPHCIFYAFIFHHLHLDVAMTVSLPRRSVLCISAMSTRVGSQSGLPAPQTVAKQIQVVSNGTSPTSGLTQEHSNVYIALWKAAKSPSDSAPV